MRGVRWRNGIFRLLAGVVAIGGLSHIAFADNKGAVRGSEMNGYGRLIFSFQDMPKASAAVTSGVLVVSFQEPVKVDLEKLPIEMPSYIGVARVDPDGKGLRFALTRALKPNLMEAGEKVFLDLLPDSWTGQPPSLPQDVIDDLARRAREAEDALRRADRKRYVEEVRAMPARVGLRPDFTRIVFEMPIVVPVNQNRVDDRIEITFDAALKVDAVKLKAQIGAAAKSVENIVENGVSRVILNLPEKSEAFGFREDDTFVLDLITPKAAKDKPSPEAARDPSKATSTQKAAAAQPENKSKPESSSTQARAPQQQPQSPQSAPQQIAQQQARPESTASSETKAPLHRVDQASLAPVKPVVTRDGDTIRIAFKFADKPPAAAFERYGVATLLFETQQPIEAIDPAAALRETGASWRVSQSGGARVVRFTFPEAKLVRLAPDGDGWVATIGDKFLAASEPVSPQRKLDENGRTIVTIPLAGAGRVHWIDDPDTGERIAVAAASAPLRSIARPYRFSEFELPQTAHGVAVVAYADDMVVRSGVDDVTIERGDGLAVSMKMERQAPTPFAEAPATVAFDRAQWADAIAGVTRDRWRALSRKVGEAERSQRPAAHLELAQFLFANGLLSETRGALDLIVREQPEAMRDRRILMLRLAVATMMNRFDDARKLLTEGGSSDDAEAQLWRAAIDVHQRQWARALIGFSNTEPMIEAYPDRLQAMMRMLWARAAVEERDFATALAQIGAVDKLDREVSNGAEIATLRARIDEEQGRSEDAIAAYARLAEGPNRRAAAEAGLRGALLGLADQSLSRQDAIAQLETVAVVWRGDGFVEADAIAALGRLYAEDNRWREAFSLARRGAEVYPNNDKIRALHDHAASLFEDIFVGGRSDSIDRLQALALFYDFKDFTPPGRQGDEIVRHLAERLVELDLLDNAAELLQHQIDRRVTGPYRSTLAARLAVIYLINRKPAAALTALKTTRLPELAYNVRRARNLLEARAMSDLSRTDLALEVAASESGPDVDRLIADIQWQGRRWRGAGETYERILGDRWKDRAPLEDRERADVLRASIAYSLAEESLSLDRMRSKYGSPMADSADARAFQLVTSPSAARAREFRELAGQVARADTLSEFLDEYRKRYPDIPPGAPKRNKARETPATDVDAAATAPANNAAPKPQAGTGPAPGAPPAAAASQG